MTADPAMILHQWLSPSFPVGAFAYSHGLEWEVAQGRVTSAAALRDWLGDCLTHGSGRTDAILLAAAWRTAPEELAELADLAEALAPSAERRVETTAQGAAFARTAAAIHGIALEPMPYPVALGRAARLLDLPLALTLRLYLQAFTANLVSAATRLVPLGQTEGQATLLALVPLIAETARAAEPGDTGAIASATLMIDLASMRHEGQGTRLFRT